jgi:hypothetical protein
VIPRPRLIVSLKGCTMRLLAFAGVFAGLMATSVAGQDAIDIRFAHAKTGDRVRVTVEEKSQTRMVTSAGGKEQIKNEVKTKSFVYVEEISESAAGAKQPTKLKRTYEKAVTGTDGKTAVHSVQGKTVLIEKKDGKYGFTVNGKVVNGESQKMLDNEFNKATKDDPRDLMFPRKSVKQGESWRIDTPALARALSDKEFRLDTAKIAGTGTLVKAYQQDGRQFGMIEMTVSAPITDMGPKGPIKLKEGSMTVTFKGDGVLDGSSPQGKSLAEMRFKVSGSGDGFDRSLEATVTEYRTMEPLAKK